MNKDITCYFSWISDKNPWKEKKKKLVWIPRNSKYLIILSRFLFFWWISQDSFHLELQARFFARGRKKILVWTAKNLEYLVILAWLLFFWSIRQDSVYLELQARIFFLSSPKDSCLNIMIEKNIVWQARKTRIWQERCQERRLVNVFIVEIVTKMISRLFIKNKKQKIKNHMVLF
jgi:hypothetical protein